MAAHQLMRKDGHIVAEGGYRIKRKAAVSAETRTRSLAKKRGRTKGHLINTSLQ